MWRIKDKTIKLSRNPQQQLELENTYTKSRYLSNTNAFQEAQKFAQTYRKKYGLTNLSQTINNQLDQQVIQQKEKVEKIIMVSRHQNKLYKSLEVADDQSRQRFRKNYQIKMMNQENHIKQNQKIQQKKFKSVNQHQKQVFLKFSQQQRKRRTKQKEQAYRLKRVQQQFYNLQKQQTNKSYQRQRNSKSLYQSALQKLEKIHKENEQYSKTSQRQLNQSLSRNNLKQELIRRKSQQSLHSNQSKQKVLQKAKQLKKSRQSLYLLKYHKNMNASQKALEHKQLEKKKSSEKINAFLEEKRKKWRQTKRQVDQQKKKVQQKCSNILARSMSGMSDSNRSVSPTGSKTHEHNALWLTRLKKYKAFRQTQRKCKQIKVDSHLNHHLQVRIKAQTGFKINQKFNSIVRKARKTSGLQNDLDSDY